MKPAVILVGADKGGVGKTTVSRVLLDYLAANNVLTRAFDTETPRGTLNRFIPISPKSSILLARRIRCAFWTRWRVPGRKSR